MVPGWMSVCVVELFEMIDVDRDDGKAVMLAAQRPPPFDGQMFFQSTAVREIRKRINPRKVVQFEIRRF